MATYRSQESVLTALSAKLVFSFETGDFGFSVASVALADGIEERNAALQSLGKSIAAVRGVFDELRQTVKVSDKNSTAISGDNILEFLEILDRLSTSEETSVDAQEGFRLLLMRPRFQSILNEEPKILVADDLWTFLDEWRNFYIPFIREIRLSFILKICHDLKTNGFFGATFGEDFPQRFLKMSIEEAASWQETAHLLASSKNASRLFASLSAAAEDRTDNLVVS